MPTPPSRSPADTRSPARTAADERWRYDVSKPSSVRTLTVSPEEPATPAKRTSPAAAATTGAPTLPAMSMPRCWPAAYGSSPLRYGVMTSPRSGHVHAACAAAGGESAEAARKTEMRAGAMDVVRRGMAATYVRGRGRRRRAEPNWSGRVAKPLHNALSRCRRPRPGRFHHLLGQRRVQSIGARARQAGDDAGGLARVRAGVDQAAQSVERS